MTVIREGELEFVFDGVLSARKFDGDDHELSHCMKAVDFIVELTDSYLFVEVKDPQHSQAPERNRRRSARSFTSGELDQDLKYKYRDSFLYEWASGRADKPIIYAVLVALDTLDDAIIGTRGRDLGRNLPLLGPDSQPWTRPIADQCLVFNIESWNRTFSDYPVTRLTQ